MRSRRGRRAAFILAALLLALLAFRLCLPALILHQVNRRLARLEGYAGRVDGIGLSLWRGEYRIEGLRVDKKGTRLPVPFVWVPAIGFSLEWRELLHGRVVTEIWMRAPQVNIVKSPKKGELETEPNRSLSDTLRSLAPFDVNRLVIRNGRVHYMDFSSEPKVDVALTDIDAVALNLSGRRVRGDALPADVRVSAKAFGSGTLEILLRAAPLKKEPTFELKQTLTGVDLVKLNDVFDAYAKVKVKSGSFGLYTEAAGKEGKFIGYAKPFLKDVVIDKKAGGAAQEAWAVVVSSVKWLVSNKRRNEIAAKIPIEGTFESTDVGVWSAVAAVLKNAYIKALTPSMEGVGLKDVEKVKKP